MANYPQYPQYPQYQGAPQIQQRPPAPQSIHNAVRLIYAGAAVSVIQLIVTLATISSVKNAVRNRSPQLTPTQVNAATSATIGIVVFFGLVGVGLWLWMAWKNGQGRSWARILSTVFFGIATLGVIGNMAQPETVASKVVGIVEWLVGLAAIIFLWMKDSSAYFNAVKEGAGYMPGSYGPAGPYPQPGYGPPGPYGQQPGAPSYGPQQGSATPYGQTPYGQPGQGSYGQPGQGSYGQPGQGSYGQPGQGSYGEPGGQYGQPGPYSGQQSPYGQQPPYGQQQQPPPGGSPDDHGDRPPPYGQ